MGGYRTVRGMMRNRVQALDVAFYNAELRWKFIDFQLFKQNIAFSLTAFSDGAIAVRPYDMSFKKDVTDFDTPALYMAAKKEYDDYRKQSTTYGKKHFDDLHATVGAGLRFIMNQNFIVAFEGAQCFNKQDGDGAFYINTGFLF